MSVPPDLVAFHVGIVVRDLHAVMDRYQRMFALEHWHLREPQPGIPLRIAYGGREGTGLAFELIEPVPGETSQWSEFLEQRGEGVQHIGFWTPDLLGSLQAAVAEGGTLVFGPFEQRGLPSCRSRCHQASSRASWPISTSAWARYASS